MILIASDEYIIRGEFLWFGVILHGDVLVPWGREVRGRLRKDIRTVAECIAAPVYAYQTNDCDPKKRRFILSIGGVFDHYRYTDEGDRAEMFRFPPLNKSKGATWVNSSSPRPRR